MPLRSLPLLPLPGCPRRIRPGRGAGPLGRAGPQAARGRRVSPRGSPFTPVPAADRSTRHRERSPKVSCQSSILPVPAVRPVTESPLVAQRTAGAHCPRTPSPVRRQPRCPGTVRERRAHGVRRVSARRAPPGAVRPGRSTRPSPASPCLAGVASVYGMVGVIKRAFGRIMAKRTGLAVRPDAYSRRSRPGRHRPPGQTGPGDGM